MALPFNATEQEKADHHKVNEDVRLKIVEQSKDEQVNSLRRAQREQVQ